MPWLAVIHTPDEDEAFFRDHVLPTSITSLATIDSKPVGFCARKDDWLDHLYILPSAWQTGIGSKLLRRVQAAVPAIQLWTFQRNTMARLFYENHGFSTAEFTDGSRNEEREPDVRHVWKTGESR